MSLTLETKIALLLIDIEAALRNLNCWDAVSPSESELQSEQPFCIDTLEFSQWLQWVFIPKVQWMLEEQMELPKNCSMLPMAEEWSKSRALYAGDLIRILEKADNLLSATA